jgi:dienelactone hydrolase
MITFRIQGVVREEASSAPLPDLFLKAFDKDLLFDDLLGSSVTDARGRFTISTEASDFRDLFERRPDLYFRVSRAPGGPAIYTTEKSLRWNVRQFSSIEIRIPWERLHEQATARVHVTGDEGEPRSAFDVGESLRLAASGLRPMQAHDIEVATERRQLFTARLLSDSRGAIEPTVLWPQMGLDDPSSARRFSPDEADSVWAGTLLTIKLSARKATVARLSARIDTAHRAPLVIASDREGRVLNAFESHEQPLYLTMRALPFRGAARVYVVPRQHDWRLGDEIRPALTTEGAQAVREIDLPDTRQQAIVELLPVDALHAGAYDFIIRRLRYGYEENDRCRLLATDIVSGRHVTGLVIRENFWNAKPVLGGCVNKVPISGRVIAGAPYFHSSDGFAIGDDVWAALDPGIIDPGNHGKMCALYVIPSKDDAQWLADNTLNHLPVLGGNAAVQMLKLQPGCVNMNRVKVWPAAMLPGQYDIVADFGNNVPDAMSFVPDDRYDTPLDVIDGYFVAGFHVVEDSGTLTDFAYAGTWHYDEMVVEALGLAGTVTVDDEIGEYYGGGTSMVGWDVPLRAHVYFPADMPGVTDPAQISPASPSYPVVVIIHGNGHNYTDYDFLLEHLARNGFVAASIHLDLGMNASGRANLFFEHMTVLQTKFGATIQNNVGVMGHSRGGEAVVKVARINHEQGLGHTIAAVMSLAPTDQYGREAFGGLWAAPFFVLYGSRDGDIGGDPPSMAVGNTWRPSGFSLYDRASGATKSMLFVYRATHNGFITLNADNAEVGLITPATQQAITRAYSTAFFRWHLRNEPKWRGMFTGEWTPPSVNATGAECYTQYREAGGKTIDDFEAVVSNWQLSTVGGSVAHGGTLPVDPAEGRLVHATSVPGLDTQSPHDTKGLKLRWDGIGDRLTYTVPPADQDFSAFTTLSLRLTQKEASPSNPPNQAQDLRLSLKDSANNQRAIRVSAFGAIPYPDQRASADLRKSALTTIRIPLAAYRIVCAGQPQVDLQHVVELALAFEITPIGEIEVDEIELV